MTSQARAVTLSKASISCRIVPDSHANPMKSRAFLILLVTPALIFFMSRKAADYAEAKASGKASISEQWPVSHTAAHGRFVAARYDLVDLRSANFIYSRAMFLARHYDSRPYWKYPKFVAGAPTNRATADLAIEHLIPCESMGKPINRVDTNGKMSYGILQFQDWDEWERVSGITGNPDNRTDAIRMAEWAIENGMINHWTCATTLKIL